MNSKKYIHDNATIYFHLLTLNQNKTSRANPRPLSTPYA